MKKIPFIEIFAISVKILFILLIAGGAVLRFQNEGFDLKYFIKIGIVLLIFMTSASVIVAHRIPVMASALKSKKVVYSIIAFAFVASVALLVI